MKERYYTQTKPIIFILLLLTIISCGNGQGSKNRNIDDRIDTTETADSTIIEKERLSPTLKDAVLELAETAIRYYDIDSSLLSESCLTMRFIGSKDEQDIFYSDSIAIVSYYICDMEYPTHQYKGVLSISNHNVAIFDDDDIGAKYYNEKKLVSIPLEKFRCLTMSVIPNLTFHMNDNGLHPWNP